MRHLPSDKYSIAWFKLAECVSRGEKERALGVYRLLSHSIEDNAFTQQLEGDILLAFGDATTALQKYQTAMDMYKQEGRLFEAVAIGEHIITLSNDKRFYALALTKLYSELDFQGKAIEYAAMMVELCLEAKQYEAAMDAVEELERLGGIEHSWMQRKKVVGALLAQGSSSQEYLIMQAQKIIDALLALNDRQAMNQFFAEIEIADIALYTILCGLQREN